jgi:hypothetical protein
MAQLAIPDYHVAESINQALASAGCMGEATVESQHTKAIAVLTARTSSDALETAAIAAALSALNLKLAHIRDPKNH